MANYLGPQEGATNKSGEDWLPRTESGDPKAMGRCKVRVAPIRSWEWLMPVFMGVEPSQTPNLVNDFARPQ